MDIDSMNAKRKEIEDSSKKTMTDDEYLCLFLNEFVCVPENLGDRHAKKELSAGIPHLLYDLINHLSGFAEVDPVLL